MSKPNIYIKPSKRGTFTAAAKKRGQGVQEFASKVLANKDNYSPAMVKKANFARNASKWNHELGGYIDFPDYSFGGWLKENAQGLVGGLQTIGGAAAMFVPGLQGAGIGLMSSGISGIANEIADGNSGDQAAQLQQQQLQQQRNLQNQQMRSNQPMYSPTFPMGGIIPYTNAELEKEEVIQTPDGNIETMNAPSHSQGGVDITAPVGSRVFSDRLKPQGSKETYAQLADKLKKEIEKYEKIINS